MQRSAFRKSLNLLDLTFLGLGSIVGSGWLFASQGAAAMAGTEAWIAWIIGAVIFILLGLVYAELGAMMPRAGGFIRYPQYTHGKLAGFFLGVTAMLAYSSVAGVEVEAVRGYASKWWPALGSQDLFHPSTLGVFVEIILLIVFFLINYWSVNVFGKINSVVTAFKFIVPLLTVIMLLANFHPANFSVGGAHPGGISGVFQAVSLSGIAFAFLGWRQSVDFGAEAKNPQRDIPIAIILAILLATALYILLQLSYLGGVPTDLLQKSGGWANLQFQQAPFAELASAVGLLWLTNLLFVDAVISPSGTGNIYLSGTARVLFAWAKTGLFYSWFGKVDKRTGIPRGALWLSLILSVLWILPAQLSFWQGLVGAVTSATVLTYMVGPVSLHTLRQTSPDMHRPFRLGGMQVIAPLAFIGSSLIIYWSGWQVNVMLITIIIASLVLYFAFVDRDDLRGRIKEDWRGAAWLFFYYIFMLVVSRFGNYGQPKGWTATIPQPWDLLIVVVGALVFYYWGVQSKLPQPEIDTDEEDEELASIRPADV
ncbi:MAG: APC family permease [Thermoflavifilum sp.]|nr:APC family permease [Thermoflavifilum sp.]MCL6515116.1 APC family permease [Alicyclobacillus sp.]